MLTKVSIKALNWPAIAPPSKTPIVVYYRANFVKTVISEIRGEESKRLCKAANVRKECHLPSTFTLNVSDFIDRALHWQVSDAIHFHFPLVYYFVLCSFCVMYT